ncbi:MAG: hypothetical protein IJ415_00415, partial [Clostridia bacterium]|nr:hypothetical protein [Clostridia bacterium]
MMIQKAKCLVEELMKNDNSGHGMEHINRVFDLSMKFAGKEKCNRDIVGLIALLHDVDDYKLFGNENQKNLTNTNLILEKIGADEFTKEQVVSQVAKMGY